MYVVRTHVVLDINYFLYTRWYDLYYSFHVRNDTTASAAA